METHSNQKKSNFFINLLILISAFLITFLLGEIFIRSYQRIVYRIPFFQSINTFEDPELGWIGKKIFGNSNTNRFKIFIVGDSFTEGQRVKEKDMYYEAIRKEFDAELFVYAAKGYGTLQEYLVIDRFFEAIKPDLIILQVCSNDLINNHWKLERMSFQNNNLVRRPYFINDHIEYHYPFWGGRYTYFFFIHSRFFAQLINRLQKLCYLLSKTGIISSIEDKIKHQKNYLNSILLEESSQATELIIKKLKQRVGSTHIVAFPVDHTEPYFSLFKKIFSGSRIYFIEDIAFKMEKESLQGKRLTLNDLNHWNVEGHHLAGNILRHSLKRIGTESLRQRSDPK